MGGDDREPIESNICYFGSSTVTSYISSVATLTGDFKISFTLMNQYNYASDRWYLSYSAAGFNEGIMTYNSSTALYLRYGGFVRNLGYSIPTDLLPHYYELERVGSITTLTVDGDLKSSNGWGVYTIRLNKISGHTSVGGSHEFSAYVWMADLRIVNSVTSTQDVILYMEESGSDRLYDSSVNGNHATVYNFTGAFRTTNNRFKSYFNEQGGSVEIIADYTGTTIFHADSQPDPIKWTFRHIDTISVNTMSFDLINSVDILNGYRFKLIPSGGNMIFRIYKLNSGTEGDLLDTAVNLYGGGVKLKITCEYKQSGNFDVKLDNGVVSETIQFTDVTYEEFDVFRFVLEDGTDIDRIKCNNVQYTEEDFTIDAGALLYVIYPLIEGTENDTSGNPAAFLGETMYNVILANGSYCYFDNRHLDFDSTTFGSTGTETTTWSFELEYKRVANGYAFILSENLSNSDFITAYFDSDSIIIRCYAGGANEIYAYVSGLNTSSWHKYKYTMTPTGGKLFIDDDEVQLTYSWGNSSTAVDISTYIIDYCRIGGGVLNQSTQYTQCDVAYFNWSDRMEYAFTSDAWILIPDRIGVIHGVIIGSVVGLWQKDPTGYLINWGMNGYDIWKEDIASELFIVPYRDDGSKLFVAPISGYTLISEHPNVDNEFMNSATIKQYLSNGMFSIDPSFWFSSPTAALAKAPSNIGLNTVDQIFARQTDVPDKINGNATFEEAQTGETLTNIIACVST